MIASPRPRTDVRGIFIAWLGTTGFFLGGLFFPMFGPALMTLTPQPGVALARRRGPGAAWPVLALVATTVDLVAGLPAAVLYLVGFGVFTLALPVLVERRAPIERVVVFGTAILAIGAAASVATWTLHPSEV